MNDDAVAVPERFTREMGFSHVEFRRALERTYADKGLRLGTHGAELPVAGGEVRIRLGTERTRRIALLQLPSTEISF